MSLSSPPDREKIRRRIHSLKTLFRTMAMRGGWYSVEMNDAILASCVACYFKDLERHKSSHNFPYADQHKRAAYTIKWVVKLRPIHPTETGPPLPLRGHMANELFAVFAGLEHLALPDQAITHFSRAYLRNLLYNLRHHPVIAETLASEMYLLECAYNSRMP